MADVKARLSADPSANVLTVREFIKEVDDINRIQKNVRNIAARWVRDGDFVNTFYIPGVPGQAPQQQNETINRAWIDNAQEAIDAALESLIKNYANLYARCGRLENVKQEPAVTVGTWPAGATAGGTALS